MLRIIIDNAVPIGRWIRGELWDHIADDLNAFYSGVRTAEDTARIMQNRVQRYLNEQP